MNCYRKDLGHGNQVWKSYIFGNKLKLNHVLSTVYFTTVKLVIFAGVNFRVPYDNNFHRLHVFYTWIYCSIDAQVYSIIIFACFNFAQKWL